MEHFSKNLSIHIHIARIKKLRPKIAPNNRNLISTIDVALLVNIRHSDAFYYNKHAHGKLSIKIRLVRRKEKGRKEAKAFFSWANVKVYLSAMCNESLTRENRNVYLMYTL